MGVEKDLVGWKAVANENTWQATSSSDNKTIERRMGKIIAASPAGIESLS